MNLSIYAAEPLLSKDILLQILKRNYYFQILTNGTLLTEEWHEILNKPNIALCISLDGIKENHNYFRGETFDKIIKNINNFPSYSQINLAMTVNIRSLQYFYKSLELLYSLPVGNFECHLNLHDNWTDELFYEYIEILSNFISIYSNKQTLPNYNLKNRFANYNIIQNYQKDRGGPLHQIDINNNILIEKPHRSCLILPDKKDLFFGKIFANDKGFLSKELKQEYNTFMKQGYSNYNYISNNCNSCKYNYICSSNRKNEVYLYPKECYPILEQFILKERFV